MSTPAFSASGRPDPVRLDIETGTARRMAAVLESALDSIITMDADGRVVDWNPAAVRTFGYAKHEAIGRELAGLIAPPAAREGHRRGLTAHLRDGSARVLGRRVELTALRRDGSELPVELIVTRTDLADGPLFTGYLRDLTELRAEQAARRDAEKRFQELIEQVPTVTYVCEFDAAATLRYISPQIEDLTGYSPEHFFADQARWAAMTHPDDRDRVAAEIERCMAEEVPFDYEYRLLHADGHVVWVWDKELLIRDDEGQVAYTQGVLVDMTAVRRSEEQLAYLAYHDTLTGLPNRARLEQTADEALARGLRNGTTTAALALGLDAFTLVNDSLGHLAGDDLLCEVARRLRAVVRASDAVARAGSDEFLVCLADIDGDPTAAATTVADKLRETLHAPFDVAGTRFHIDASVGIAVWPGHAERTEELLRAADAALHAAKGRGGGQVEVFRPTGADPRDRLTLTRRLRHALEADELLLHFQPVVDLTSGAPVGVEALVRWDDPERGMVPPGAFIPAAEASGLIVELGEWVADKACGQMRAWHDLDLDVHVAINVAARQVQRADLDARLEAAIRRHGVAPERLVVEITESAAMADADRAEPVLERLHDLGIQLAIDDFGTQHSSLSRLRDFPFDLLKLDRSFLRQVCHDAGTATIVRAVIALADGLAMRAVAEGVETDAQRAFLVEAGCPLGQGFALGRPLPAGPATDVLLAAARTATPQSGRAGRPGEPAAS